jgi:hypothetical protein
VPASVPVSARWLPRPAQLSQPQLEASQKTAGITPLRRVYDIRQTFATFALRAGISTFDLSRYMGTSLAMIDRHYGHLARDEREHAIRLLDTYRDTEPLDVHAVDTRWTLNDTRSASADNEKGG